MDQPLFIPGDVFKRSQIHDRFGGNAQSGISTSGKFPYIFIFSGQSGHQHGYKDQWENENVFSYTGEGQSDHMQFVRGNLALRDHINNGKRIFLFSQTRKAFVQFESELELIDVGFFPATDRHGKERRAIKFFFKRVGLLNYEIDSSLLSQVADSEEDWNSNIPNTTERKGLVTSRVGQGAYRKSILFRWNFKCAVTNYSKNEILIASHILAWKDSTPHERLDVDNGILLSPVYDALFDQHLISFENNGKIILSDSLSKTRYQDIGVTGKENISKFSRDNYPYLERHREKII